MQRCPICRARLKDDTPTCPRCSTDLSKPLNIETQADNLCYQAIMQLGAGHLGDADCAIKQSLQLKRNPLALALQGFIRHHG